MDEVLKAADALAEAVRDGVFGPTRDRERKTREAGYEDYREWLEDALNKYEKAAREWRQKASFE